MAPVEISSDDLYYGDEESNASKSPVSVVFEQADSEGRKSKVYEPLPEYVAAQYEDIERYRPGGFHPVHIGDYLDDDQRFVVLHKLGFGSSSTVWLCFDQYSQSYKAIKVVAADESPLRCHDSAEVDALAQKAKEEGLYHSIITTLENFWIEGPNGQHLCLVMPVLGPNLLDGLEGAGLDTPEYLTDLCFDLAATVGYLHEHGIVHGDIRPQKIMVVLADQWMWTVSRKDLFEHYLEKPATLKLKLLIRNFGHHGPKYVVPRAKLASLEKDFRTGKVALTDFSHACQSSALLDTSTLHHSAYSAPEIRLANETHGLSSDIWSLAACIHLLRTGKELLPQMSSDPAHITWLTWVFGPRLNIPIIRIKEVLAQNSVVPVNSNIREEEEVHKWLDDLEKPSSQYRRAEAARTFKRAVRSKAKLLASSDSRGSSSCDEDSSLSDSSSEPLTGSSINRKISRRARARLNQFAEVLLPGNWAEWELLRYQHEDRTGYPTLLHEFLCSSEIWYEMPESMRSRGAFSSSSESSQPLLSTRAVSLSRDRNKSKSRSRPVLTESPELRRSERIKKHAADASPFSSFKKQRIGEVPIVEPAIDSRDQVSCDVMNDGMIEYTYRMCCEEVAVFADLLLKMLQPLSRDRKGVRDILRHAWFGERRRRSRSESVDIPIDDLSAL
ncbi:serine/threonine-protein kinase SRPK3 [Seiridium cupressi]